MDAVMLSVEEISDKRRRHVGPNVALSYSQPLHIVRGQGCYLYDPADREHLDCVNNVSHVGHTHPEVTAAMCKQLATLNTNCRYLHEGYAKYSEALAATLPDPLKVVTLVCSGSEANDLALRVARAASPHAASGRPLHVAVMGGAYHGHVSSTIDCSPYKFSNPGGAGRPDHVHVLPYPDPYRGLHLDGRRAAREAIDRAAAAGAVLYAFIAESLMSCAGQVVFPAGYLQDVYDEMHGAGVLCIADEVQVGFGRVGSCFWGFQLAGPGLVPDIITLGKPMGNGFPMGAMVTSPECAACFDNGMEYFSTFGGCTGAGATGLAVLRVLQQEEMQQRAAHTGEYLLAQLRQIQQDVCPDLLGDVRGEGLMIGMEWVTDVASKEHAPAMAAWVKERCREEGVLLSTDGMLENVIKVKPPMCFGRREADMLVDTLRRVLTQQLTPEVKAALIEDSRRRVDERRALWRSLEEKDQVRPGAASGYLPDGQPVWYKASVTPGSCSSGESTDSLCSMMRMASFGDC